MKKVLITGASGFIGFHLVRQLSLSGCEIWCIVRKNSNRSLIEPFKPIFLEADITDRQSVLSAFSKTRFDVVFHLAAVTLSHDSKAFFLCNETGAANIANACAQCATPPVLVLLSSLAARGPDQLVTGVMENPVSEYGKSKLAGEIAAKRVSASVPVSIVRAPIVYGEADRDGVAMYASIQNYGLHLVPGLTENHYSLIYAGDLAIACELIARQGRRVTTDADSTTGIYYPAAMQTHTFAGFGRAIAHGMDKKEPKIVRVPALVIWFVAALTEIGSRISGSNGLVNRDKAREANAGSWTCNSTRLQQDTGFIAGTSLEQGLKKTILWYRQAGWLNS